MPNVVPEHLECPRAASPVDAEIPTARDERVELLSWAAAQLLTGGDPHDFLDLLFERLGRHLDLEVYFNFIVDEQRTGWMRLAAWRGVSDETAASLLELQFGVAVCGTVAATRKPMVVDDVQGSSDPLTELIRAFDITAYICHPLITGGRLIGTLSFGTRRGRGFDEGAVALVCAVCSLVAAAIERHRGEQVLHEVNDRLRDALLLSQRHEQQQDVLMAELNHRVKNTLLTVQAIASQTARSSDTMESFNSGFRGRLQALARAHGMLARANWSALPLERLVGQMLDAYQRRNGENLAFGGPAVDLHPRAALSMSMILHELTTNSAKHGALSAPDGHVDVRWTTTGDEGQVCLVWEESGGPPVTPPTRRGFGTSMIERSVEYELGGAAELEFRPAGVRCVIGFGTSA